MSRCYGSQPLFASPTAVVTSSRSVHGLAASAENPAVFHPRASMGRSATSWCASKLSHSLACAGAKPATVHALAKLMYSAVDDAPYVASPATQAVASEAESQRGASHW